jgi:hypothetical protein
LFPRRSLWSPGSPNPTTPLPASIARSHFAPGGTQPQRRPFGVVEWLAVRRVGPGIRPRQPPIKPLLASSPRGREPLPDGEDSRCIPHRSNDQWRPLASCADRGDVWRTVEQQISPLHEHAAPLEVSPAIIAANHLILLLVRQRRFDDIRIGRITFVHHGGAGGAPAMQAGRSLYRRTSAREIILTSVDVAAICSTSLSRPFHSIMTLRIGSSSVARW